MWSPSHQSVRLCGISGGVGALRRSSIAHISTCSTCNGVSAGIVKSGYGRTVPSSARRRDSIPSSPLSRRGRFGECGSDRPAMRHWRLRSDSRKPATQASSGVAISVYTLCLLDSGGGSNLLFQLCPASGAVLATLGSHVSRMRIRAAMI